MTAEKVQGEPRTGGRFRRILIWLSTALVALVLLLFAISNRADTELHFWPLPFVLGAPLYLVSLILLIGGFLLGHFIGWLGQGRWRRAARRDARRVTALEQELAAYHQAVASHDAMKPVPPSPVALTSRIDR